MATKTTKTAKTTKAVKTVKKTAIVSAPGKREKKDVYFYAVGRRKTSVARVRLFSQKSLKENEVVINGKTVQEYVTVPEFRQILFAPFELTGQNKGFRATVVVRGGGVRGQVEAIRLGVARALAVFDANFRPVLKTAGLLTRDARKVERKKAGLKKARRAPQWAKR